MFYAGLQPYGNDNYEAALYIIGYFTVGEVIDFNKLSRQECATCYERFPNNAHVKRHDNYSDMLLIVGDPHRSKLLRKGIRISQLGKDRAGRPLHVVSEEMEKLLGVTGSIERSPPRTITGDVHVGDLLRLLEEPN